MTNVDTLKKLASKITGATIIPGSTIAEIVNFIADNYDGMELAELTVSSVAGTEIDYTRITVTPTIGDGNHYVYKTQSTAITPPVYGDDLSTWTSWDGVSEITAEDRHYIYVAEVGNDNKAVAGGTARISTKIG